MSRFAVATIAGLGPGFVLAPQRYVGAVVAASDAVPLGSIAQLAGTNVRAGTMGHLVDTGDLEGGIVRGDVAIRGLASAGSVKRALLPGDVVISRLRPYLRQIAFVDDELPQPLLASTELLVLRPIDPRRDTAFLVPFLLGVSAQAVLLGSVEGGQHPRFRPEVLLSLPVPSGLVASGDRIGRDLRHAIALRRASERALALLV